MSSNISVSLTQENVGPMARRLREYLSSDGIQLKQSHAYEALAKVFGHKNWNTLKALLPSESVAPNKQHLEAAVVVATARDEELASPPPMSKEQFSALMKRDGFELVVNRWIADERWGGVLVTVHQREAGFNIEHDDEVLFRHRNTLEFNIFLRNDDLSERPLTDRVILNAAIRRLSGYVNSLKVRVAKKDHFKSTRALGAIPASRFTKHRAKSSGQEPHSARSVS